MSDSTTWVVEEAAVGSRLDRHVAEKLDQTRNQVQRWIGEQWVTVNGRAVKPSCAVALGDEIQCIPPERPSEAALQPQKGDLDLLYVDEDLVVVNKPAGLVVHPGAGRADGTLVHFLLHDFPDVALVGGEERPGIVHRLDLDTTGVMVVARSERAYRSLTAAFAERSVTKIYRAVAYGTPKETEGTIELPIARHGRDRKKMSVRRHGRLAVTHYRCHGSALGISNFELDLATGRTHQIRVHLKALGHPLVGDPVYGEARWRGLPKRESRILSRFPRPALHAHRLTLNHPADDREMTFEAPIPEDLRTLWEDVTGRKWS